MMLLLLAAPAQPRGPTNADIFRGLNGGLAPGPRFGLHPNTGLGLSHFSSPPPVAGLRTALYRTPPALSFAPLYFYDLRYGFELPVYRSPRLPSPPRQGPAYLTVRVWPDAEVLLDGRKVSQRGMVRAFATPPLRPGEKHSLDLTVRWTEDGKPVERKRKVELTPGTSVRLDFIEEPR
jgi:uncharacterized protein (TIGR03000 family)